MAETRVTQFIAANPDSVFRHATDLQRWPEFISGIERIELLTDAPVVGVGTRFRETRVMFGKEATEEMEIKEYSPPRTYSLAAESGGCRYDSRFTFEPQSGGTLVTMVFHAQPLNLIAKVLSVAMLPMMKWSVQKCVRQDLSDLKQAIESAASLPA